MKRSAVWASANNAYREISSGNMTTEQALTELKALYPVKEQRLEVIRAFNTLAKEHNRKHDNLQRRQFASQNGG